MDMPLSDISADYDVMYYRSRDDFSFHNISGPAVIWTSTNEKDYYILGVYIGTEYPNGSKIDKKLINCGLKELVPYNEWPEEVKKRFYIKYKLTH